MLFFVQSYCFFKKISHSANQLTSKASYSPFDVWFLAEFHAKMESENGRRRREHAIIQTERIGKAMKTVGEKIAELRKQKNMTQEDFGAMLGISAQSVSKWENHVSMPDISLIPIIADTFDITIDELFDKKASIPSVKTEDMIESAFEKLLKIIFSYFDIGDNFEEYKNSINADNDTSTALYTENGVLWGNENIGIIYRKSAKDSIPLLKDDEARAYLAMLANESVCKILAYMAENGNKSFTAASVAAKCGITAENAESSLKLLKKHHLAASQTVDLGDETVTVWKKGSSHKMFFIYSMLLLAQKAYTCEDNYYCYRGDRSWC